MRINYSRLILLLCLLSIIQLIVNSNTIFYIDCFTLVMVVILLNNLFPIRLLMCISVSADLIGHWYLGSHLIAIVLVSMLTTAFIKFYMACGFLQKTILVGIFSLFAYLILAILDLLLHNNSFSWLSLIFELIFISPIIIWLMNTMVLKTKPGMIIDV